MFLKAQMGSVLFLDGLGASICLYYASNWGPKSECSQICVFKTLV